jgi:hypothetical protein
MLVMKTTPVTFPPGWLRAGDQAVLDRVASGREDRHRRRCGLGRECRSNVPDDHGHRAANYISHQRRQSILLTLRRSEFDRDVLALDEACFLQTLAERGHEMSERRERRVAEKPDYRHRRLLRACRERPCGRAAEQRDELPTSQVRHGLPSGTR